MSARSTNRYERSRARALAPGRRAGRETRSGLACFVFRRRTQRVEHHLGDLHARRGLCSAAGVAAAAGTAMCCGYGSRKTGVSATAMRARGRLGLLQDAPRVPWEPNIMIYSSDSFCCWHGTRRLLLAMPHFSSPSGEESPTAALAGLLPVPLGRDSPRPRAGRWQQRIPSIRGSPLLQ